MRYVASPESEAHHSMHAGVALPGTNPSTTPEGREDKMSTHRTIRSSLPAARALSALLLASLWGFGLPAPVPGATAPASYKVLYAFPLSAAPPLNPSGNQVTPSGLLRGADGNFYGTTYYGGANDEGAVFMLTPTGTYTPVYSFPAGGADGAYPSPAAGLIQDGAGNLYGTTQRGGPNDLGTVFKLPATSTPTLHVFTVTAGDGEYPQGGVVRDPSGNLYGTTCGDCVSVGSAYGTVFKLAPNGSDFTLTTLHTFSGTDGAYPLGSLVRDPAGNLYGTTLGDGVYNYGTVFKLAPSGETFTPTTLHTFNGTDEANPQGGLVRDPAGNLYGMTFGTCTAGGDPCTGNVGTVFQLTPSGETFTFRTLYTFTCTVNPNSCPNGANPYGTLTLDSQGTLYGSTYAGGPANLGTLFQLTLTPTPTLTTLHPFAGPEGANPQAGLTLGSDGYFYGTTSQGGGTGQSGVAFVLRVGNPLTVTPAGTGTGTVTSTPTGISCGATCSEVFLPTATVTLTAAAAVSSTFTGWSGTGITCAGTGPCSVPMTQEQTVTATFTLKTFALTVQRGGTGTGSVSSTPSGITCGADCSEPFSYNTLVTLTATATSPSVFTGWSGGGCSGTGTCKVTMIDLQTVTATFSPPTVPLTVAVGGSSGGTVTSAAPAITCTATCPVDVTSGTKVTLAAAAGTGGAFKGWTGACTGTLSCVVTMDAPKAVTAVFSKTFTDALTAGSTPIKAVHFTDLRAAIDTLRSHYPPLGPFGWTDAALTPGSTVVRRQHLLDLRTALDAAYSAATKTHAAYADLTITAGTTPIKASHLNELRGFVKNLVCLVNGICEP
jgi:uncharacterized repeat protein (TIGR03803 family)